MLELSGVETWYGPSQVLFGIDLSMSEGKLVSLLGRNGMGKTTLIRSITGLTPPRAGKINFLAENIAGMPAYRIGQRGIGLVPEGRQVFPTLTVRENLIAAAANRYNQKEPWTLERTFARFPTLGERSGQLGQYLSGGEQQMLAIGRALMTNPRLLILDEATEGLAPMIRDKIWDVLKQLKSDGQTILIVDKNIDALADIADWHYIIEKGAIVWQGDSDQLTSDPGLLPRYLGV